MARIEIREKNLETLNPGYDTTDIAYIPGFGTCGENSEPDTRANVPTFVATVARFKELFGSKPVKFTKEYSDGFSVEGAPAFKEGDFDPAWTYAVKVLESGIPIYYEKINTTTAELSAVDMYNAFVGEEKETEETTTEQWTDFPMGQDPDVTFTFKHKFSTISSVKRKFKGEAEKKVTNYITLEDNSGIIVSECDPAITESVTVTYKYKAVEVKDSIFDKLKDRGAYRIKYLTTGGYPIYEHKKFAQIKENLKQNFSTKTSIEAGETEKTGRGDCLVFIDHTDIPDRDLIGEDSVYGKLNQNKPFGEEDGTYFAMFTPWCFVSPVFIPDEKEEELEKGISMPASLLYLMKLGKALHSGIYWDSIAGVNRGCVETIINEPNTSKPITATIANEYQSEGQGNKGKVCINAITEVYPYGQCIMGIRTLEPIPQENQLNADNIINLRLMVCDIKKTVYRAAKALMFEQNSAVLWVKFKNNLLPLLDKMVASNMIKSYSLTQVKENSYGENYDLKRCLRAALSIVPVYPVEQFIVDISITDDDVEIN